MEFEKIRDVIVAHFGEDGKISAEAMTPNTTFAGDLAADSLDILQIISQLEEEFGMEFNEEDADKIVTVGDAAEFVKKALKAG